MLDSLLLSDAISPEYWDAITKKLGPDLTRVLEDAIEDVREYYYERGADNKEEELTGRMW
jgi:hypothetical protein